MSGGIVIAIQLQTHRATVSGQRSGGMAAPATSFERHLCFAALETTQSSANDENKQIYR
jgi:hypothetical protein